MSADHDYAGDYGYDLAHELRAVLQMPSSRARIRPAVGGHLPGRELDLSGDLGYDQAHEL